MTTNIKLFENWIAEEEAAETPVAPTAATTVPAVKPTDYKAQNTIGGGKVMQAIISCIPPFDIAKSTLRINEIPTTDVGSVQFTYDSTLKTWKSADSISFQKAFTALIKITDKSRAKRSLAGIIVDALTFTGDSVAWNYNPNLADSKSSTTIDRLVAACGTNSFRGAVPADAAQISELAGIDSTPITNLTVTTEVNIDTLIPTGKFNILVNNAGSGPFTSISDDVITKLVGKGSALGSNLVVKQKITTVLTDLIAKSKIEAAKPI